MKNVTDLEVKVQLLEERVMLQQERITELVTQRRKSNRKLLKLTKENAAQKDRLDYWNFRFGQLQQRGIY